MTTSDLVFDPNADVNMTSLRGYLDSPWSFEETVARLITLSGQDGTENGDGYKVSVEFTGTFRGAVFTLYDYKGGMSLHIGGHGDVPTRAGMPKRLDVDAFQRALIHALYAVAPTPYTATIRYDDLDGQTHEWR